MSARTDLVAALRVAMPTYRITDTKGVQDGIKRPTVGVWMQSLTRRPEWQKGHAQLNFELWVLVPQEDSDRADDALDDALADVLEALNGLDWLDWSTCTRGVLFESIHGYNVTVSAVAKIGD